MTIRLSEIAPNKMSVNPPQAVVNADYCIIANGKVMQYVGIGWCELREATENDYKNIPYLLAPHCSQCLHYECFRII